MERDVRSLFAWRTEPLSSRAAPGRRTDDSRRAASRRRPGDCGRRRIGQPAEKGDGLSYVVSGYAGAFAPVAHVVLHGSTSGRPLQLPRPTRCSPCLRHRNLNGRSGQFWHDARLPDRTPLEPLIDRELPLTGAKDALHTILNMVASAARRRSGLRKAIDPSPGGADPAGPVRPPPGQLRI